MNFTTIIIATIAHYALGMIWYSKALFQLSWIKEMGWDALSKVELEKKMRESSRAFAFALIVSLAHSVSMAWILRLAGTTTLTAALRTAALAWLGFLGVMSYGGYMMTRMPKRLWAVNQGYYLSGFLLIAIVLTFLS